MQRIVFILGIFVFLSHTYARRKGTGEPCPIFIWNLSKISLYRFEKYFASWYPYVPLFHLPYKVWTLTPWFRLWRFWPTVLVFQSCLINCAWLHTLFHAADILAFYYFFNFSSFDRWRCKSKMCKTTAKFITSWNVCKQFWTLF